MGVWRRDMDESLANTCKFPNFIKKKNGKNIVAVTRIILKNLTSNIL